MMKQSEDKKNRKIADNDLYRNSGGGLCTAGFVWSGRMGAFMVLLRTGTISM